MLLIFFDDYCPLCTKTKAFLERIDFLGQLQFVGIRQEETFIRFNQLDKTESLKRMATADNGTIKYGFESVFRIIKKLPQLWLFYPLFFLFKITNTGNWFYDQIASRRGIMAFSCDDDCKLTNKHD